MLAVWPSSSARRRLVPPVAARMPSNFPIITENREPILNGHLISGFMDHPPYPRLNVFVFERIADLTRFRKKIDVSFKQTSLAECN